MNKSKKFLFVAIIIVELIGLLISIFGFHVLEEKIILLSGEIHEKHPHILVFEDYPLVIALKDCIVYISIYKDIAIYITILSILVVAIVLGYFYYKGKKVSKGK